MGLVADATALSTAFAVPLIGYVCVLLFALLGPKRDRAPAGAPLAVDPG